MRPPPPIFARAAPWLAAGDLIAPILGVPFALIAATLPGGALNAGDCAAPRADIISYKYFWNSGTGLCATWVGYANSCLDGQIASGGDWLAARRTVSKMGMYNTVAGPRYQVVSTRCYPANFGANPMRPQARPRERTGRLPATTPQPIRDAILGRGLPHGREVNNDPVPQFDPGFVNPENGIVIVIRRDTSGRVRTDLQPVPQPFSPPQPARPQERERKGKWEKVAAFLWRSLSAYSEGRDLIEVVWKSLPARLRTARRRDTWGQLLDIYENAHAIDFEDFLVNWFLNEAEDQLIGRMIREAKRRGYGQLINRLNQNNSYYLHNSAAPAG